MGRKQTTKKREMVIQVSNTPIAQPVLKCMYDIFVSMVPIVVRYMKHMIMVEASFTKMI